MPKSTDYDGTNFFSQARIVSPDGKRDSGWQDICDGHDTIGDADECNAQFEQVVDQIVRTGSAEVAAGGRLSLGAVAPLAFFTSAAKGGNKVEFRLVRRDWTVKETALEPDIADLSNLKP